MNDVERDLRELFEHKASEARVSLHAPALVLRRSRRRQLGTMLVSSLTLLAVIAVAIAGARSLLRSDRTEIPGGRREPFSRTATIQGFTITSPSDWVLIDEWPLASTIATGTSSSSFACTAAPIASGAQGEESCTSDAPSTESISVPTGLPVLQLTNFDPGLGETICSSGSPAENGTNAGLYVAVDVNQLQGNRSEIIGGTPLPSWPVPYDQSGHIEQDGPCGAGWYEHFRVGDVPYMSFLTYGTPAPEEVIQTLIDAFESMSVHTVPFQGSPEQTPGYVVAGGTTSVSGWRIEVRPSDANVDMHLIVDEQGGPGVADFGVPSAANLEFSGGDPTFGAITTEAEAVELRPGDGSASIPGTIFELPASLNAPFDAFFITTGGVSGDVVAIGPGGDLEVTSGVPATETPTAANQSAGEEGQAALRNALAAAKTFYTDGATYEGFTPKRAEAIEPSIPFNDALEAVTGAVSIRDVARNSLLLVTRDEAGDVFCIADDVDAGATTYGLIDAHRAAECNGTAALWGGAGTVLTTVPPPVGGELQEAIQGFGQVAALRLYRDADNYCYEFLGGMTGVTGCSTAPFQSDKPYLSLDVVLAAEGVWLEGTVPADVELVRIVLDGGGERTIDLSGPATEPELGDVELMLVALAGTEGAGSISFEDADGGELYDAIAFDWPIPANAGNEVL